MKTWKWIAVSTVALASFAALGSAWMRAQQKPVSEEPGATPTSVRTVLYAQPFVLAESYRHEWRRDEFSVEAGWILVLDVDPTLVSPHQTAEPVLYVGDQTAERINQGDQSGHVVAIVPSHLDAAAGMPSTDLTNALMWFGTPRLPEDVDASILARERLLAVKAGIAPIATDALVKAEARGGKLAVFKDRTELDRYAATLITVWSPDEYDIAQSMLAPLVAK